MRASGRKGILEVADRAGVSPATVSRALRGLPGVSEARRAMVRQAADDLGYVASPSAASLPTGRTQAVGVMVPWITRWFFTALIDGAQSVLAEAGYDVMLFSIDPTTEPETWPIHLLAKRVDGLLAFCLPLTQQHRDLLSRSQTAVAHVGVWQPGIPTVGIKDRQVGRIAAAHLVELGHQRIGFVGGDAVGSYEIPVGQARLGGCREVLAEAGLQMSPQDVIGAEYSVRGGECAFGVFQRSRQRPSAVLAGCDEIAIGFIHAARSAGLQVPGDISVIGVDDHDLARVFGLSTVRQDVREQGRVAADLLVQRLAEPACEMDNVYLPAQLVARATTARI